MNTFKIILFVFEGVAIVAYFTCLAITIQKGKTKLAIFGLFLPGLVFFGAGLVAKPNSQWADRHYGPKKMALARREFPKIAEEMDRNSADAASESR